MNIPLLMLSGVTMMSNTDNTRNFPGGLDRYVGTLSAGCGTAISRHWVLTAKHLSVRPGDLFRLGGEAFTVVQTVDNPSGPDLTLCRVDGAFREFAPLSNDSDILGKPCVFLGAGRTGTSVYYQGQLRGWTWADSAAMSWGMNVVDGIYQDFIIVHFDSNGGPFESTLTSGDSGGGLFVNGYLVGVNHSASGTYSLGPSGPGFAASIFDARGLYTNVGENWYRFSNGPTEIPGVFMATRVSSARDWIRAVIHPISKPTGLSTR